MNKVCKPCYRAAKIAKGKVWTENLRWALEKNGCVMGKPENCPLAPVIKAMMENQNVK